MAEKDTAAIAAEDVHLKFGDAEIHKGVTFSIARGNIAAIIGGSGSGKSTLLKEILGLLRPTSGRVLLFGEDVWSGEEVAIQRIRKRYGVLFQNGALFSALTVGENVAVPLQEQTKLGSEMIESIVQLRLALTGLPPNTCQKMPSELSGGMRKRVALARALALEPDILFLDEPTSGLDPTAARAFDQLINTLSESLGLTIFMVTHDLDSIHSITNQVIVLDQGKVVADGPVEEVSKNPNSFIQSYFSSRVQ